MAADVLISSGIRSRNFIQFEKNCTTKYLSWSPLIIYPFDAAVGVGSISPAAVYRTKGFNVEYASFICRRPDLIITMKHKGSMQAGRTALSRAPVS
jgi:hypothetical protein